MAEKKETLPFLFGLCLGALIGAGLSIILAPESGKEIREKFKDKASELAERGKESMAKLREIIRQEIEALEEHWKEFAEGVRAGVEKFVEITKEEKKT